MKTLERAAMEALELIQSVNDKSDNGEEWDPTAIIESLLEDMKDSQERMKRRFNREREKNPKLPDMSDAKRLWATDPVIHIKLVALIGLFSLPVYDPKFVSGLGKTVESLAKVAQSNNDVVVY